MKLKNRLLRITCDGGAATGKSTGAKLISKKYFVCGGGRKNDTLIKDINYFLNKKDLTLQNIDNYDFDGDFIESQAFAFLSIRSYLNLPISFNTTTGCKEFTVGGKLVENF